MPIYDYGCSSCEHVFEAIQKMDDPPPEICPSCNEADTLTRIFNISPTFVLKGRGWEKDGYMKPVPHKDRIKK